MDELPGGYWDAAGRLHREFELAPLTGREEELLAGAGDAGPALVTTVLSRTVRRLGEISPVPPEVAAGLLIADRLYLLLRLRAASFGENVRADLFCPWQDCGQRISLAFSLADLPVVRSAAPAPVYTASTAEAGEAVFRLPNGADQQELAASVAENEAWALTLLLSRCLHRLGTIESPSPEQVAALPARVRAELETCLYEAAPRVDQTIEVGCAACGRTFIAPFDIERFLFGDLRTDGDLLYREVHYLAFHYHWSEREIMEMTRDRRRTYIDVLTETIEVLNSEA
ncbi:hypothetical protein ABZ907_38875 [Nonomuraea wenchangensis]